MCDVSTCSFVSKECTARAAIDSAYGQFLGSIYIVCFAAGRSVMFTVWLSVKYCAFIFKNKILSLIYVSLDINNARL